MTKISLVIMMILVFGIVGNATTHITDCQYGGTAISGGSYDFTGNITVSSSYNSYANCILISNITSNVYLDCGGYTLTNNSTAKAINIGYTGSGYSPYVVYINHCKITGTSLVASGSSFTGGTVIKGYNQSVIVDNGTFVNTFFDFQDPVGQYYNTYAVQTSDITNGTISFNGGFGPIAYGNTITITTPINLGYGISCLDTWTPGIQYNTIVGYSIVSSWGLDDGIAIINSGANSSNTPTTAGVISHNTISKVYDAGIEFIGNVKDGTITYNSISIAEVGIGHYINLGENNMTYDNNDFASDTSGRDMFLFSDIYNGAVTTYFTNITVSNNRFHSTAYGTVADNYFGWNNNLSVGYSNVTLTSNDFDNYSNGGGLSTLYLGGSMYSTHDGGSNHCGSDTQGSISCSN